MSRIRSKRLLLKFCAGLIIVGMIMLLLPMGNIFAGGWGPVDSDLTKGDTQDGGNGATYFMKWDSGVDGTLNFPPTGFTSPCAGQALEITEVLIKAGGYLIVYYPIGSPRVWQWLEDPSDPPHKIWIEITPGTIPITAFAVLILFITSFFCFHFIYYLDFALS